MRVHITNLYGLTGAGTEVQQSVAAIAKRNLQYNELGIYYYPVEADTEEMLRTRLDGILASLSGGDVVIMQFPTWNDFRFDVHLMDAICNYWGVGKIILIHDILPLRREIWDTNLKKYIEFYNRADVIIVPTQNMADFLRENGLRVNKIVVQKMYDCTVSADRSCKPLFRKTMNLVGNPDWDNRVQFCKQWNQDVVQLMVTANEGAWAERRNIRFLGQFQNDHLLIEALRKSGGFGLLWTEDSYWKKYIKMNASYELSIYLAAGLPVIVPAGVGEQDTIVRKNLGIVAESLEEAVERIESMSEVEYQEMATNVEKFSHLLREGFFTKKALTDAVFQLLN